MISKQTKIINQSGLHARPASEFVRTASKFKSKITICRTNETDSKMDAKSIMGLLTLGLCRNDEVEIEANGEDEAEAVESLVSMINQGFGE